jgi:hypothetical protein
MQRALVNSFGFGGKNIVIAVSGVDVAASQDRLVHGGVGALYHEPIAAPAMAKSPSPDLVQ